MCSVQHASKDDEGILHEVLLDVGRQVSSFRALPQETRARVEQDRLTPAMPSAAPP